MLGQASFQIDTGLCPPRQPRHPHSPISPHPKATRSRNHSCVSFTPGAVSLTTGWAAAQRGEALPPQVWPQALVGHMETGVLPAPQGHPEDQLPFCLPASSPSQAGMSRRLVLGRPGLLRAWPRDATLSPTDAGKPGLPHSPFHQPPGPNCSAQSPSEESEMKPTCHLIVTTTDDPGVTRSPVSRATGVFTRLRSPTGGPHLPPVNGPKQTPKGPSPSPAQAQQGTRGRGGLSILSPPGHRPRGKPLSH